MHYYQFNIGDYKSHTDHLDPIEDIAYRRMIDHCYLHEIALPLDTKEISRLIRMRTNCEVIEVVLSEFFVKKNDGYICKRVIKDIKAFKEKSNKAKKSAEARWNKSNKDKELDNKPSDSETDANALPSDSESNTNHKPLTNNQKPSNKDNRAKRFTPPTIQEATDYFEVRAKAKNIFINQSEPESFIDFYQSKNWMVGKNKMKDWKAAIRNWLKSVKTEDKNIFKQSSESDWHLEDLGL